MSTKIYNAKYIKTLDPCERGLDNFKKHYPRFKGSLSEILKLDKIPYDDKIWLASKEVPTKIIKEWSVLCAEQTLHNFEKVFPNDTRVRDCINTIKSIKDFDNITQQEIKKLSAAESAASAAWSAASAASAAESAARSAARSAASAASAAWSAARSAAESAARSAARSAAESAAWSAASAASAAWSAARSAAEKKQEDVNIKILIKLLEKEGL